MNPALSAIAGITVAGAVLAVCARDPRAAVLGILIVLLAAPLVADPWPGPIPILARVAAALLAARLLVIPLRGDAQGAGTEIGWPAEALIAAAATVVGLGSHGLGAPALGPREAQGAGFGLVALAIAPLLTGRDVLRLGTGAILLVQAALLIHQGLDGSATEGEQLVAGLLTIGLGGAVAVIASAAQAGGGLTIVDDPDRRSRAVGTRSSLGVTPPVRRRRLRPPAVEPAVPETRRARSDP